MAEFTEGGCPFYNWGVPNTLGPGFCAFCRLSLFAIFSNRTRPYIRSVHSHRHVCSTSYNIMEGTSPTFCLHPDQDDIEAIERELLASPLGSSGSDNCSLHHTPSYHTPGLDPASIQLPPSPAPLENCHTTEPPPTDPLEYASPSDERICRICFAGEEDQAISGRLFSPCRCSGTARHVHGMYPKAALSPVPSTAHHIHGRADGPTLLRPVKCLAAWRNSATNKTAFYECSQCRFQYRFARTRISGLATNRGR